MQGGGVGEQGGGVGEQSGCLCSLQSQGLQQQQQSGLVCSVF